MVFMVLRRHRLDVIMCCMIVICMLNPQNGTNPNFMDINLYIYIFELTNIVYNASFKCIDPKQIYFIFKIEWFSLQYFLIVTLKFILNVYKINEI